MIVRMNRHKKAQSLIEFALLFVIVAAAITITHRYVYGAVNARLKRIQEELSNSK